MKKLKFIVLLVTAALMLSILPMGVSAAVSGEPGETVKVTFSVKDVYGAQGKLSFDNLDLFTNYKVEGAYYGMTTKTLSIMSQSGVKETLTFTVTATLRSDANPGDSCTITFNGVRVEAPNATSGPSVNIAETVTVKAKPVDTTVPVAPPDTKPVVPPDTKPAAPDTTPSTPVTEPSAPSTPSNPSRPSTPGVKIDYTELNRQIDIANGLKKDGYTDASWDAMISALANARNHRSSNSQAAVDSAAKQLKDAIAALQTIDYTALKKAVDEASKFSEEDEKELTELWNAYVAALDNAKEMFASGDQAAVDKAAADLEAALSALRAKLESMEKAVVKEVEKEVEKEVDPKGPFCNITMHRVWLILLIISAVLNIGFIVLIVLWFLKKKKTAKDDTPLVNYDIGDDD